MQVHSRTTQPQLNFKHHSQFGFDEIAHQFAQCVAQITWQYEFDTHIRAFMSDTPRVSETDNNLLRNSAVVTHLC